MLQTSAIEPGTLALLKRLMNVPELQGASLVGGTALALKFGHRKSIDLDLFVNENFKQKEIEMALEREFGSEFVYEPTKITFALFCMIQSIKVDIVNYPHPILKPIELMEGISFYDNADISAMKINAILGRGNKKDFFDLAELLKHYSLGQIMEWHKKKYPNQMILISIPNAITYFEDAEQSENPVSLNGETWESVKNSIKKSVRDYLA